MRKKEMLQVAGKIESIMRADFEKWYGVAALAGVVGLSEWQLQRFFKTVHGITVIVFERQLHLKQGLELLVQYD